jgi:hypothetical protein
MLRTVPGWPAASQRRPQASVQLTEPLSTMPTTASIARGDSSSLLATKLPAALLTSACSGPSSSSRSTIASTASASRTSQAWVVTTPPVAFSCSRAVASSTSARRPQIARPAPSSRNRRPMLLPRPVPPPVIRMRLPARRSGWNIAHRPLIKPARS